MDLAPGNQPSSDGGLPSVAPEYYDATQSPSGSPTRRKTIAAIAATSVVLAGVGIGAVALHSSGGGTPVSNAQLLTLIHSASAALKHEPASTFRMTVSISAQGQHEVLTMSGVTDNRTKASTFTMSGPGIEQGAISLNGIAYIQVPTASVSANHGKPWLAVHAAKPTPAMKKLSDSGPGGLLQSLSSVDGKIENEGTDDVLGTKATRYAFHANFLKTFGPTFRQIFGADAIDKLKQLGFDNLPMKLWLDNEGLPRKMALDFSFHGVTENEIAYMTPTTVVPKISAPPASEVRMVGSLHKYGALIRQFAGA